MREFVGHLGVAHRLALIVGKLGRHRERIVHLNEDRQGRNRLRITSV
jgi:hypothetical protein